jgi:hypothetical protein
VQRIAEGWGWGVEKRVVSSPPSGFGGGGGGGDDDGD